MADESRGDSLTNRLMARGGGLHRRSMPDGGEVYSGPVAQRALRTLGARAMTMDKSILVDDDFDPNKPEDAALYAHEKHHQDESGGKDDGHGARDQEEIEARQIERMVLHRSTAGEDLGSIMRDMKSGGGKKGKGKGKGRDDGEEFQAMGNVAMSGGANMDPMDAYHDMIAEGKNHMIIVRELKDYVVGTLMRLEEEHLFRSTDHDFF